MPLRIAASGTGSGSGGRRRLVVGCLLLAAAIGAGFWAKQFIGNDARRFRTLLSTGSNAEIGSAMKGYFVEGEPASRSSAILPLANASATNQDGQVYIFWFRGKDPKIEGDYWLEVTVDPRAQTIRKVRVNGYIR